MDPVIDMLIRIKNAQAVKKEQVSIPFSRTKLAIVKVLKDSGFIQEFERKSRKLKNSEHEAIIITLRYNEKDAGIDGIKIISRPSRRMYMKAKDIKLVRSGYGIGIISTSRGIMSSIEARRNKLGGEIICEIW